MYELERKPTEYQEVSQAQSSSASEAGAADDMSAPFELWLDRVKAEPISENGTSAPLVPTPQRAETPPPSTQLEYVTGFDLRFKGTLHIDGYFTGNVRSESGTLVLAEGGEINTDIVVGVAMINGTVVGNIDARQKIELGSAARVIGDLHTAALTVAPGAIFEGKCFFRAAPKANGRRLGPPDGSEESSGPGYMRPPQRQPKRKKPRAARKPDRRRS